MKREEKVDPYMTVQPRGSSLFLVDSRGVFSHTMNDEIDKIAYWFNRLPTPLALRFFQCRDWKNHSANEEGPVNLVWDMGKIDN